MHERIVIDPHIQHGKPVIGGTRVPVARVIGSLAGSMTPEDICQDYGIEAADLRAALQYAAECKAAASVDLRLGKKAEIMESITQKDAYKVHPPRTPEERRALWKETQAIWRRRATDAVEDIRKLRDEWDRELPPLHKK